MARKAGRRHSDADQKLIQAIHNAAVELGADDQAPMKSAAVKSITDDAVVVAGYGLIFGEHDLAGDTFETDTDFDLDLVPSKPVFYDHTLTEIKHRLGVITTVKADERGLWIEAQLQRSAEYVEEVLRLIEDGMLGWSSGSIAHLVRRDGGTIKSWPLVEFSLTPTPCEPRTLGVRPLKSDTPQATEQASGEDADVAAASPLPSPSNTPQETSPVDENKAENEIVEQTIDVDGAIKSAVDAAIKAFAEAQPVQHVAGFVTPDAKVEDKAEASAVKSFTFYVRSGVKAALNEGTAGQGGYLVPTKYSNELIQSLKDASILRAAGARVMPVSGTNAFKMAARTGTAAAVLTGEGAAFDQKEPTFTEVTFTPYKYTRLTLASDEVLADSRIDVVSQVIMPDVAQAFAAAENTAFATGTGTGQPQGIVTGSGVGVTAASATAITGDELINLYHSLGYLYRQNAVWLMNDATIKLVRTLKNGGEYIWQPGLQAGQPDRLLGRPVITLNSMATPAANAKTVVFADLSRAFIIADFAGLEMKRLEELYAATGQVGFRWFKRMDSRVVLAEASKVLQQAAA